MYRQYVSMDPIPWISSAVDTSEAGEAELQCIVDQSGRIITSNLTKTGSHQYMVSFLPDGPGEHHIRALYGGQDVRGKLSPSSPGNINLHVPHFTKILQMHIG